MNAHSHAIGSHSHGYSGTTTSDGLHYHFINAWDSFNSDTRSDSIESNKLNARIGDKPAPSSFTHNSVNTSDYIKSGEVTIFYPNYYNLDKKYLATSDFIDCEADGIMNTSHIYTHYNQKYTSYSGGHSHVYSGTTNSVQPSCSSTTSSGTFTGTRGTTDSNGSGTSFSIMPPYIVKYCWERTA